MRVVKPVRSGVMGKNASMLWAKVVTKIRNLSNRRSVTSGILRALPILHWLPQYNSEKAVGDLIAGITVGLTLIPQSIAYAGLAGLDPQYGLYSSLCGGFIYACFGTVKDLNIAPTALVSLLTYSYTKNTPHPQSAIIMCFAAGILQLLFGIFRLGFLVDFVSSPVVSGFTSAGALTIAASQLKSMFGLAFHAESFLEVLYKVLTNIGHTNWPDAVLSVVCCVLLIGLREMRKWGHPPTLDLAGLPKTLIWFVSIGRNAIIVIASSLIVYCASIDHISLGNAVIGNLPPLQTPFRTGEAFWEDLRSLGSGIITITLVSILSNMAIAKAFTSGQKLRASQEMSTLGLCNVIGSFVGSYPVNASFSRAALNNASGARTTFGGIYTGTMVILSLTFLMKYFQYIPKAALASVLFCAVIYMVELQIFVELWQSSSSDLIPLTITFGWSLCDSIERGILIGVLIDLLRMIWWSSRPHLHEVTQLRDEYAFTILSLNGNCLFCSGEYLRMKFEKCIRSIQNVCPKIFFLVVDCDKLVRLDYTAAKALGGFIKHCETRNDNNFRLKIVFLRLSDILKTKVEELSEVEITTIENEIKVDDELGRLQREFRDNCMPNEHLPGVSTTIC